MATVIGYQDDKLLALPRNVCWAEWRAGVPCPNEWTHAVENIRKPGFMKVCEQHKDGFMRIVEPQQVVVYTKAEWEALGREAIIMQQIKEAKGEQAEQDDA